MAFCKACGAELGGAAFCPKCGASQSASAAAAPVAVAPSSTNEGLAENVAGTLAYAFGWISGLIFLLIDKRPFVKFHAAQSIALNIAFFAVWLAFWIISAMLTVITAALHFPIGVLSFFLAPVIGIGFIVIWIFMMVKAYGHQKYKLPVIGNMVEGMVK